MPMTIPHNPWENPREKDMKRKRHFWKYNIMSLFSVKPQIAAKNDNSWFWGNAGNIT